MRRSVGPFLVVALLVLAFAAPSRAAILTVTNNLDSGAGSLRQAILTANGNADFDEIRFNLDVGERIIAPATPLPSISHPTAINGMSQPGYAGVPLIGLNGATSAGFGLRFLGNLSSVTGLAIYGFAVGVSMEGNLCVVESNYIGLTTAGAGGSGNTGNGLQIFGDFCGIGGTTAPERNVISGNGTNGISIGADVTDTLIYGNYIGTNPAGTAAIGNGTYGIRSFGEDNQIGTNAAGGGNVISGNQRGISLESDGDVGTSVRGNIIGLNAAGTAKLFSNGTGIEIYSDNNTIGGTFAGDRNIISGNKFQGITISADSTGNAIQGNYIGTNPAGTAALGNDGYGVHIAGDANAVGGDTIAASNLISGNGGGGIYVAEDAVGNVILGNYVGTDKTGSLALGNASYGIVVDGGETQIGGSDAGEANLISANGAGVSLRGNDNALQGNYIGTTADGNGDLGNENAGVSVSGSLNLIGGSAAGAGNLISGNGGDGIDVVDAQGTRVFGNRVGTRKDGMAALANGSHAMRLITSTDTEIGGTAPGEGNVFSGNGRGVSFDADAPNNLMQGNIVGLAADGQTSLGNAGSGLEIASSGNTIGGSEAGAGNVFSSNTYYGVVLQGPSATDNLIQGNRIGVAADGSTLRGNWFNVVFYGASGNTIGGTAPGEGNIIADAANVGVYVWFGHENEILGNSIHSNGGLGIDLEPQGIVPNDPLDADTGSNESQNAPVITSAVVDGAQLVVQGQLASGPSTSYRVEFFSNPSCDSFGFGEGRFYLGSAQVMTNEDGIAAISTSVPWNSDDSVVTATATNPSGNTSEFSACATVNEGSNPGILQFSQEQYLGYEELGVVTITVTRSGGATGEVSVDYATVEDTATSPEDFQHVSGTLTFADGEVVKSFDVPVVLDGDEVGNEEIDLELTNASGADLGALSEAHVLLFDYELSFPGVFISDVTVLESDAGEQDATFYVTLTPTDHEVQVKVCTTSGSALDTEDFDGVEVDLVFAPGDAPKPVVVPILGDNATEGLEEFYMLACGQLIPGGYAGNVGHGFIIDDESPLPPPLCGNGLTQAPEGCDDNDTQYVTGDYCSADCVRYECGVPTKAGSALPKAGDALFVLRAAVQESNCAFQVCDVNDNGDVQASDALLILRKAVDQPVTLTCPDL